MIKLPNGYYDCHLFDVEPQLSWFTSAELALNIWMVNKTKKYSLKADYIINDGRICKGQCERYCIQESGIIRFGPLTDVLNIQNPPNKNRFVTVRIYYKKVKVLCLQYEIPEFWPLDIPSLGDPVPSFRVTIASCLRLPGDTGAEPVFPCQLYCDFRNKIIEMRNKNNLVFLLGDNVYLNNYNYDTHSGIIARYRQLQRLPQLMGAWSAATWSAITNDHDMSINNGTYGAPSIDLCEQILAQVWPAMNPVTNISPIIFSFTRFDVLFIGLDDRRYRTNPGDIDSTILGNKQIEWLKQSLYTALELVGESAIIFIGTGTPFLPPGEGYFSDYPLERQRIIDIINNFGLKNVFFLSGDSHFSDVSILGNITEIRNSALSSRPRNPDRFPNPYRVPGSAVGENNFGTLDIEGNFGQRVIKYKDYTENGIAFQIDFEQR